MLTGRLPFQVDRPMEMVLKYALETAPSPRQFVPNLPPTVEKIVTRALSNSAETRYQSAAEMREAFRQALSTASTDELLAMAKPSEFPTDAPQSDETPTYMHIAQPSALRAPPRGYLHVSTSGQTIAIPPKVEVVLGRTHLASQHFPDIDLDRYAPPHAGISREHAKLIIQGGQWLLQDMQSTNGTFVNGRRLASGERVALQEGDQLRFGRFVVLFKEQS